MTYHGGEIPMRGDVVEHAETFVPGHKESEELWVVTSICDDMIRAKALDADRWRQAFYTKNMKLVERKKGGN